MSAVTASYAFCSNCGTGVTGRFCSACGAPAGPAQDEAPVSTTTAMSDRIGSTVEITKQIGAEQVLPALKAARQIGAEQVVPALKTATRVGAAHVSPWMRLAFQPLQQIKAYAAQPAPRLWAFLLSYIAFAVLIGLFNYLVLTAAAANLSFPWTFTDRIDEFGMIAVLVGIAVNCLATFVVYLLPDTLFEPVGKTRCLCLFFVIMMYSELYHTLSSLAFIVYWIITQDGDTLAALKAFRTVAIIGFGFFAIRRGIGLSLDRSVAIVALSTLVAVVAAGAFFASGMWQIV